MNKKVKVALRELAKSVTAEVDISYDGDNIPDNEAIVKETAELFEKAQKVASNETLKKVSRM